LGQEKWQVTEEESPTRVKDRLSFSDGHTSAYVAGSTRSISGKSRAAGFPLAIRVA